MYIDTCKTGKYTRHLLRESYRENGKVKNRTILNISHLKDSEIDALKLALKHKDQLHKLGAINEQNTKVIQGKSMGALWTIHQVAKEIGITQALGNTRDGKLALWQVYARVLDQGSRLSAVRLATSQCACEILGIHESFNEEDLYHNLNWIHDNQSKIESKLFNSLYSEGKKPELFLYDVTSSYLEGSQNELGAFGYNRDGKKGKKQIVIGLLCDQEGNALSIEVFPGNTNDTKTFSNQILKVIQKFGTDEVTLVGDRGMIKGPQIEEIQENGLHYITAITNSQIETLCKNGTIQMELFEDSLAEVETEEARYILRRNPVRAKEIECVRQEKMKCLMKMIEDRNEYLKTHPKAKVETALKNCEEYLEKLKLEMWIKIDLSDSVIEMKVDDKMLEELRKYDGCYALKTDLPQQKASKEVVHSRYKDLSKVESGFRTCKTGHLEMRPIHVRKEERTKAHAFVVMMAYRIVQHLENCWKDLDHTVEEGLDLLKTLCTCEVIIEDKNLGSKIPTPEKSVSVLLKHAGIILPKSIKPSKINVTTKNKYKKSR